MRIYYAHCMAIYSTPQEDRDVATLEAIFPGEAVINPNTPMINMQCMQVRDVINLRNAVAVDKLDPSFEVLTRIFEPLVKSCNLLVFRALPDGMIPAGVLKEIQWAEETGIPVLELPSAMTRRELSVAATKQYLREIGQR